MQWHFVSSCMHTFPHAHTHAHTHTHAHMHARTHTHLKYGKAIESVLWVVKHSCFRNRNGCHKPSDSKDNEIPIVGALEECFVLVEVDVEEQQASYLEQEEKADCKLVEVGAREW